MRELTIKELLKLYEEGKATEEQRQLAEKFLERFQAQGPRQELPEGGEDSSLQEIMDKIHAARENNTDPVYQPEPGDYREEPRKIRWLGWAAAAAIVLLIAGMLWTHTSHQPVATPLATVYKTVEAKPGQSVHLLLSDSSEVWLSAGSKLRYPSPLGDSIRQIELIDGEAFFQVHPDASRGFEVRTEHLLTRVLGTSFNIKSFRGSQRSGVSVVTGKVSVGTTSAGNSLLLTASQQVICNNNTGKLTQGSFIIPKTGVWKNDSFRFAEETLGDIAIELEHYYNVKIGFKYPGLRKYQVTGSFSHQTPLKDILNTICLLNQNHVTQTDAQHYVIH